MICYSCDRCQRQIHEEREQRYEVRIEIQAAVDTVETDDADDDRDHLLELQEILERLEDADPDELVEDVYRKDRFDLCPDCYQQYCRNPLGRESAVGFSHN